MLSFKETHKPDSMLKHAQTLWNRKRPRVPTEGFAFDRPLVLLQSDDWGRVGVRDLEGFEQIRSSGVALGEKPYDFYSLETADDVGALGDLLAGHRDVAGRSACLEMNFVLANIDFKKCAMDDWRAVHLLPLNEGLPGAWMRPGLFEAYANGISSEVFLPALHGLTHFSRLSVEHHAAQGGGTETELQRTLWRAETPYIHWRMPWVGYEYSVPEGEAYERFLPASRQQRLIDEAVRIFVKLFAATPLSACAPGYRSNRDTICAWAKHGIRVAQNGPGCVCPPYFDDSGLLQLFRTIDFEPAVNPSFSLSDALRSTEECIVRGIPSVISIHSINFHSTIKDFRGTTLHQLDQFLSVLEQKYPDLLYVTDADLWDVVQRGVYERAGSKTTVRATKCDLSNWIAAGQSA
jgi:hypothetical protein